MGLSGTIVKTAVKGTGKAAVGGAKVLGKGAAAGTKALGNEVSQLGSDVKALGQKAASATSNRGQQAASKFGTLMDNMDTTGKSAENGFNY